MVVQLFSLYILPLAGTIQSFKDIYYHYYADDIQVYVSFKPPQLNKLSTLVKFFFNYLTAFQ